MRVVREVERDLTAALTESYNLEEIGARGLIYLSNQDQGTTFTLSGLVFTGALGHTIVRYTPATGGGFDDQVLFGIPLPYQSVTFAWAGAGTRHNRILFVDEPVRPFGKVPLGKFNGTLGAGANTTIYTTLAPGLVKYIQLVSTGDRAHRYNLGQQIGALTITLPAIVSIAAAAGGPSVSAQIPAGRTYTLTLFNDDGANSLIYSGVLWGLFD